MLLLVFVRSGLPEIESDTGLGFYLVPGRRSQTGNER